MGWKKVTIMSQRREFVQFALQEGANISELCRRFGISRKTGYKLLGRYHHAGEPGLADRSRRPHHCPHRTPEEIEQVIVALRAQHPVWGPRTLRRRLEALGYDELPAPSTLSTILTRHGLICPEEAAKHRAFTRFQAAAPNRLWQMDFKGHFPTHEGRCHPLTLLDDHSRYALCLAACANEQGPTVQHHLHHVFTRYGLPDALLVDNGPPWGTEGEPGYTTLGVWLLRLGIKLYHSRVRHPQTLGKDERFHRTLKAELLPACLGRPLAECQQQFDHWRHIYNSQRPHHALQLEVPASRYRPSDRPFPKTLPPITYGPDAQLRHIQDGGLLHFKGRTLRVGRALKGQPVAVRPTTSTGQFEVVFCHQIIAQIDLNDEDEKTPL